MKNATLLLFLCFTFWGALIAQQSEIHKGEQIVFLKNGITLQGVLEEVNRKKVRISTSGNSFTIKKNQIKQLVPADIYSEALMETTESIVIFEGKDWLKAEILEVSQKSVLLKSDGVLKRIRRSQIFKIYPTSQKFEDAEELSKKADAFSQLDILDLGIETKRRKKGGLYNISSILIKPRLTFAISGLGFQHTVGYRFSPYFGLGLHVGVTKYGADLGSLFSRERNGFCIDFCSFAPDFMTVSSGLSLRGELNRRKIRPYYNIDFGINKGIRSQEVKELIELFENSTDLVYDRENSTWNPGFLVQPSIGMQINGRSLTLLLDIGFQFSNVNYETDWLDVRADQTFTLLNNFEEIRGFIFRVGILL